MDRDRGGERQCLARDEFLDGDLPSFPPCLSSPLLLSFYLFTTFLFHLCFYVFVPLSCSLPFADFSSLLDCLLLPSSAIYSTPFCLFLPSFLFTIFLPPFPSALLSCPFPNVSSCLLSHFHLLLFFPPCSSSYFHFNVQPSALSLLSSSSLLW